MKPQANSHGEGGGGAGASALAEVFPPNLLPTGLSRVYGQICMDYTR